MCRVEFSKIGKRDVTFIREMRVHFTKDENAPSERISHHYVAPAPGARCRVSNPGISVLLCVNWRFHKANYFGRPNRSTPQIKQMPVVKTSRLLEKIITGGPSLTRPPLTRFIFKDRICILFFCHSHCHSHSALCNVYPVALDRTKR